MLSRKLEKGLWEHWAELKFEGKKTVIVTSLSKAEKAVRKHLLSPKTKRDRTVAVEFEFCSALTSAKQSTDARTLKSVCIATAIVAIWVDLSGECVAEESSSSESSEALESAASDEWLLSDAFQWPPSVRRILESSEWLKVGYDVCSQLAAVSSSPYSLQCAPQWWLEVSGMCQTPGHSLAGLCLATLGLRLPTDCCIVSRVAAVLRLFYAFCSVPRETMPSAMHASDILTFAESRAFVRQTHIGCILQCAVSDVLFPNASGVSQPSEMQSAAHSVWRKKRCAELTEMGAQQLADAYLQQCAPLTVSALRNLKCLHRFALTFDVWLFFHRFGMDASSVAFHRGLRQQTVTDCIVDSVQCGFEYNWLRLANACVLRRHTSQTQLWALESAPVFDRRLLKLQLAVLCALKPQIAAVLEKRTHLAAFFSQKRESLSKEEFCANVSALFESIKLSRLREDSRLTAVPFWVLRLILAHTRRVIIQQCL